MNNITRLKCKPDNLPTFTNIMNTTAKIYYATHNNDNLQSLNYH